MSSHKAVKKYSLSIILRTHPVWQLSATFWRSPPPLSAPRPLDSKLCGRPLGQNLDFTARTGAPRVAVPGPRVSSGYCLGPCRCAFWGLWRKRRLSARKVGQHPPYVFFYFWGGCVAPRLAAKKSSLSILLRTHSGCELSATFLTLPSPSQRPTPTSFPIV
jgi:hypothetical protein